MGEKSNDKFVEDLRRAELEKLQVLTEANDVEGLDFLKKRLGVLDSVEEVSRKPIFFAPSMHSDHWVYDQELMEKGEGDETRYASFELINRALVREIRRSPELAFLYDQCEGVVLDCFKEGGIEGIYMISFLVKGGEKMEGVIQVGKSERQNELVIKDADRLKKMHSRGRVPKVYASGPLSLTEGTVFYKLVQFLPSNEISVHNVDGVREFHFLEGDAPTEVPHYVMGNKMMEAVYEVMFSHPEVQCVPEILRGDLVWMKDPSDPTNIDKGRVMLISTANALTMEDSPYYQKLKISLGEELESVGHSELLQDVFSMLSAIDVRFDSKATDAHYRQEAGMEVMDEGVEKNEVYPYSALNLLNGLVSAHLDDVAFARAASSLFYALWYMTRDGRKTRTHPMLTGLCRLYADLHVIWEGLSQTDETMFIEELRKALNGLSEEKQAAFEQGTLNKPNALYGV